MRLQALPVFHLMLIGLILSQGCVGGRLSLNMYVYTYDFGATNCGLLVQGKIGGGGGGGERGRLVHWVEKASLEKIRKLLEISELERHYEVLLTLKNLADVRRSPTRYSLPIIPRPLPSEIVEGEHFVTTDMLSLIAGSASPFGDPTPETSNREQASRAPSVLLASTSGDSNPAPPGPSRGERVIHQARLPLPRKGIGSAPRVLKIKKKGTNRGKNAPGAQVKDFVP